MANTSRKRPPPAPTSSSYGTAASSHHPSTKSLPSGIDQLLAKYARHIPPGSSITIQLIKGPTTSSVDPIAARRAAAKAARTSAAAPGGGMSSGNDSDTNNVAPAASSKKGINVPINFPRMAKFIETVSPPDFTCVGNGKLGDGRMYEEEVPKAKDESDEEESTAYKQPIIEMGDASNPNPKIIEVSNKIKKKRKRWRRHDVRPRRWVLQEKSEFFDRIRKRKQRGNAGTGGDDDDDDEQGISNQYHGVAEANASKYVILSVAPPQPPQAMQMDMSSPPTTVASETISVQPIHGFHTFSQPYKFASLTMEEAESAIEKQRNVVTRYMMHGKLASQNNSNEGRAALASGVAAVGVGGGRGSRALNRPIGPAPKAMSRARLLGKLAGGGEDDDDVMADVRYSSSKGSGRARKELLTTLGDEGVTADDDGVLGGANDSEFGGRRRFGRVNVNKDAEDAKKGGKGGGAKTSTGFEAGAMEEGFYQRDVAAEYEALDYDANEQFDDDDVNVGEDEMMDDGGGYGGDFNDSGDDMLDSDDDDAGSDDDGFKGMATSSGFKSMLAKARGESPVTATSGGTDNNAGNDMLDAYMKSTPDSGSDGGKGMDRMMDAAKKTADAAKTSTPEDKKSLETEKIKAMGIEKDKDGKRLITLDAVRREIWLNNGAITSKRLTKKFDVTKKNPERQALFKTIVMELCTIKKDADGNKLVLKQHYAKI